MKKILSAILVCFLLVGSMLALVACNGAKGDIDNGTYVYENEQVKITLKVDGNKLTMVQPQGETATIEQVYTYELTEDGAKIKLTPVEMKYNGDEESIKTYVDATNAAIKALEELAGDELAAALEELVMEGAFEKTETGIKLEDQEYVKQ